MVFRYFDTAVFCSVVLCLPAVAFVLPLRFFNQALFVFYAFVLCIFCHTFYFPAQFVEVLAPAALCTSRAHRFIPLPPPELAFFIVHIIRVQHPHGSAISIEFYHLALSRLAAVVFCALSVVRRIQHSLRPPVSVEFCIPRTDHDLDHLDPCSA